MKTQPTHPLTAAHPQPLEKRLSLASTKLMLRMPFFGSLLGHLHMSISDDLGGKSAVTDGKQITFNRAYCDYITDSHLVTVFMEQILHPAMEHLWRAGARDWEKWTLASTLEALHIIEEYQQDCTAGGQGNIFDLPPGYWIDHKLTDDNAAEGIYDLLPDAPPQPQGEGDGQGEGSGEPGHPQAMPGGMEQPKDRPGGKSAAEQEEERQQWRSRIVEAALAEKAERQGRLPAGLQRILGELTAPKVRWQDVLREWMVAHFCKEDYNWSRPNRRYAASGFILPGLHGERSGEIVLAVDTSGSVDGDLLREFFSEMQGIMDQCRPEKVHCLDCDAAVHQHVEMTAHDDLRDFMPKGGGGTDFEPVFEHVAKADITPVGLVYFTDLCGSFPDAPPDYPVLWAVYGGAQHQPPFGTKMEVKA